MKNIVLSAVFIIILGFGYIGFSVVSFEPEPPRRFDLSAQQTYDIEQLKDDAQLTEEEVNQKERIVNLLKTTVSNYESVWQDAPMQAENFLEAFDSSVKNGSLPVFYPLSNATSGPTQSLLSYETLAPVSTVAANVPDNAEEGVVSEAKCTGLEGYIVGDTGRNRLTCEASFGKEVVVHLAGPDDDQIYATGNSIIDAGSGNDAIQAGPEFTMIYVSPDFGKDILRIDCLNAEPNLPDSKTLKDVPWTYDYVHFVVFAPQIAKETIEVSENTIRHVNGEDQIVFNEACFNVVFLSQE